MNRRALPIINAIGCLALTGLVLAQWRKERLRDGVLARLGTELAAAKDQAAVEAKHRVSLERDITVLKESIEATQRAAESSALSLAEKELATTQLQSELSAARTQVTAWEAALKTRDDRIRSLDGNLATTRKRLDEAIAKLKAAAAR
jgi:chromosome segregation ATPase